MLVFKGGQIKNVQLITGVGSTYKFAVSKYSKSTAGILPQKNYCVNAPPTKKVGGGEGGGGGGTGEFMRTKI